MKDFVYKSHHAPSLKRRNEWFLPLEPHLVLWRIPEGHCPTVNEGKARLSLLKEKGPTPEAFDFSKLVAVPKSADLS